MSETKDKTRRRGVRKIYEIRARSRMPEVEREKLWSS